MKKKSSSKVKELQESVALQADALGTLAQQIVSLTDVLQTLLIATSLLVEKGIITDSEIKDRAKAILEQAKEADGRPS